MINRSRCLSFILNQVKNRESQAFLWCQGSCFVYVIYSVYDGEKDEHTTTTAAAADDVLKTR